MCCQLHYCMSLTSSGRECVDRDLGLRVNAASSYDPWISSLESLDQLRTAQWQVGHRIQKYLLQYQDWNISSNRLIDVEEAK